MRLNQKQNITFMVFIEAHKDTKERYTITGQHRGDGNEEKDGWKSHFV